jgi:hypothetical protein
MEVGADSDRVDEQELPGALRWLRPFFHCASNPVVKLMLEVRPSCICRLSLERCLATP